VVEEEEQQQPKQESKSQSPVSAFEVKQKSEKVVWKILGVKSVIEQA
jgi:hypothetical protein